MPGKPVVFWDSGAFIAHLNNETSKGQRALRHLKAMLQSASDGDLQITASTLAIVEVFECHMSQEAKDDFMEMMSSAVRGITVFDPGTTIMLKARELREWSKGVLKGKVLSTPDAIHLATAYYAGAAKFYTFDGITPARARDQNVKLLPLDGLMPEGLRILEPDMDDPSIDSLFDK